ncbi:DUF4365 domain-containing protein [Peptococcaceae bacterium 1198_IL3148]
MANYFSHGITTKTNNETKAKAQSIFLDMLPTSWTVQGNSFNNGIDFYISSETMFAISIKGTAKPQYSGNNIICCIETRKLEYFSKHIAKPVFIVLVDIDMKRTYWLFIQEYIETLLEKNQPNWRCKKTVNLKIPLTNTLQDFNTFNAAILRATNLMLLYQYKLPFLMVSTSLEEAINHCQPAESQHHSCASDICSSTSCSCSSTDEIDLSQQYLIMGEKHYHEYITSLNQQKHNNCFAAMHNLMHSILRAMDEGLYFIAAKLTLRLTDIYFLAFTDLSKTVGANKAFALMDSGEILLERAHSLITKIEAPNSVLN